MPASPLARRSTYLKFRDRQSYEFALVSVAAALEIDDGIVTGARLALGGVGTKPWRARRAEELLVGAPADAASFRRAADAELAAAVVHRDNALQGRARRARRRAGALGAGGMSAVGTPVTRVDGPAKVTGAARYTAELALSEARAPRHRRRDRRERPRHRDRRRARRACPTASSPCSPTRTSPPIPAVPRLLPSLLGQAAPGMSFFPLQDDVVHYAGQPVALVVADSHERAQHAAGWSASPTRPRRRSPPSTPAASDAYEPERLFGGLMPGRDERGDVDAALGRADARIDVAVRMAANHHNPMEAPSTLAEWDGDRLTIHESTMGVRATQLTVAHLLGLPLAHVRVLAPFVGGSFGMKAMVWPGVTLAAIAAREVGRPVRLMLTRPQMFTSNGHREEQEQRLALGATREGRLTAIDHAKLSVGSPFDDWAEPATGVSSQLYAVEQLPRRSPPGPRQHHDADLHARPRRGARRLDARDGHGRARLRARDRPGGAAPSQPHRRSTRAATRGPATASRSACASAPSASAGPVATRRRAARATATG